MCARVLCSRSTAIDLLTSRRARGDNNRQHIQHQLDSLRFYDSVPLHDGLRQLAPPTSDHAPTGHAPIGHAPSTGRGDSPWPPGPPTTAKARRPHSRKRLRRVASEPMDPSARNGRHKTAGGLWNHGGCGRPTAAPRWPTTAETVGGLRPRHWPPPVGERGGPYWIRLESALTMTKPEDEENPGDAEEEGGRTFEYRVDVPASEQRRGTTTSTNHHHHHHHHGKSSNQQQQMYLTNEDHHYLPSPGHHYPPAVPDPPLPQLGNSRQFPNGGYHLYPSDAAQGQYPTAERSYPDNGGYRYPTTQRQYPNSAAGVGENERSVDGCGTNENGEGVATHVGGATLVEGPDDDRQQQQRAQQPSTSCDRRHHRQRVNRPDDDIIVTSSTPFVDPPRYELFTHV